MDHMAIAVVNTKLFRKKLDKESSFPNRVHKSTQGHILRSILVVHSGNSAHSGPFL